MRAADYAGIVKWWSRRRKLESAASAFAQAAHENETDKRAEFLQQARALLREAEMARAGVADWRKADGIPLLVIVGFCQSCICFILAVL